MKLHSTAGPITNSSDEVFVDHREIIKKLNSIYDINLNTLICDPWIYEEEGNEDNFSIEEYEKVISGDMPKPKEYYEIEKYLNPLHEPEPYRDIVIPDNTDRGKLLTLIFRNIDYKIFYSDYRSPEVEVDFEPTMIFILEFLRTVHKSKAIVYNTGARLILTNATEKDKEFIEVLNGIKEHVSIFRLY